MSELTALSIENPVSKLTNAPTPEKSFEEFFAEIVDFLYEEFPTTEVEFKLDYATAFQISCALKDFETCKDCTGYPCKKKTCKGHKPFIEINNGSIVFGYIICKHSATAKKQALANKRLKAAQIPPMYISKTFDDYQIDANNKNTVAWAKKLESIYIFGRPGTGKTFLASIMAQELLKQGKSVIFGDVPTILDQLKGTFDNDSDSSLEELMQILSAVDVLILDDLGTETPTEWAVERLYLIVNNRYTAGKKLIVTSNYNPDDAENRLNNPKSKGRSASEGVTGSRIISRIKQMCKLTTLGGADKRGR